jgi:ATP-dependent Clp protease ATP-binding subunit ClpA
MLLEGMLKPQPCASIAVETTMVDRFDIFTERARKSLERAQEEAQRLNHNWIGTEHLLLGLVREGERVPAWDLANLGIEPSTIRDAVELYIGRGDRTGAVGEIRVSRSAKRAIQLSFDEAQRLNHYYVGTHHLLLGLLREGKGIASGVLQSLEVSLEKLRSLDMYEPDEWEANARSARAPPPPGLMGFSAGAGRAREEAAITARWFYHPEVSTAHLLVGLLREQAGLEVLRRCVLRACAWSRRWRR